MKRPEVPATQPTESAVQYSSMLRPFYFAGAKHLTGGAPHSNPQIRSHIAFQKAPRSLLGLLVMSLALLTQLQLQPVHASSWASRCQEPGNLVQTHEVRLQGYIAKVSDGDTIHFMVDSLAALAQAPSAPCLDSSAGQSGVDIQSARRLKVRMTGIDTPELHLPVPGGVASQGYWAEAAQVRLAALLPINSRAELIDYGKDHYGRTLGRVLSNGRDVHLTLLKEGLAALYLICTGASCNEEFYKNQRVEQYARACQYAVDHQVGIFSERGGLDELPFEFRLRKQNRIADKWVGNLKTKQLHAPEDYKQVPVCDRIFFPAKDEAIALGYTPAS